MNTRPESRRGAVSLAASAEMTTLKNVLAERVSPGELYDRMPDHPGWVQCYACGHLCRIPPGRDGICRVRTNRDGTLYVPDGYVGALQCDPVEKKPFFHALPGSLALSFGMLGCDYHCSYCFTGETRVVTNRGVVRIDSLVPERSIRMPGGGEAGTLPGWEALTHEGRFSPIRQVFRHPYRGPVLAVTPYDLPAFRCTPEHRVCATADPAVPPSWLEARSLTTAHFLAVPKPRPEGSRELGGRPSRPVRPMLQWDEEETAVATMTAVDTPVPVAGPTAPEDLAYAVAWLALRRGRLPGVHLARDAEPIHPQAIEHEAHFLVPIRAIAEENHDGFVYNLEVEGARSYTANFFAVHNCQNWITSQTLRDPGAIAPPMRITPEELVDLAVEHGAPIVASTYNEPLITSEWAVKVFRQAREHELLGAYISNGNATPRVLDYLRPYVDLYKVDLKGFDARRYHELGGVLQTVLDTIVNLKSRGFWVEVVTLVVPGFNDSEEEIGGIARFLAGVDRDIPWHVTAFHQDYRMTDRPDTSVELLLRAVEIGRAAGLRFVYAGNRPGRVGQLESTHCPGCGGLLIERTGYVVRANRLRDGRCPDCHAAIPGVWTRPGRRSA